MKCLNSSTERYNIPVIGAIHPSKNVLPTKELELEDIRANSAFINIPSNIYSLNNLSKIDGNLRVICILKCRKNGNAVGNYFLLNYRKTKNGGIYEKDQEISINEAKKLIASNKRPYFSGKMNEN